MTKQSIEIYVILIYKNKKEKEKKSLRKDSSEWTNW